MKLLKLALEKQDYYLAAHVLIYGLIKAQINPYPENPQDFRVLHNYHGKKSNKKRRGEITSSST